MKNKPFFILQLLLFWVLFWSPLLGYAFDEKIPKKIKRHFDINKNKRVDLYERQLILTHLRLGWPLADNKTKQKYDFNNDLMLGPFEYKQYQERKKPNPRAIPGYKF